MKSRKAINILAVLYFVVAGMSLQAEVNRWSKIGPDGGDILKLIMDPRMSQTIYAITNNAGLFKTTDGGIQWRSIDGELPDYPATIRCLIIHPHNSSILYVGAGDGSVYRSTDEGEHWTLLSSPGQIYDIAISPVNDNIVFAGTNAGVLKSTDGGVTWSPAYDPAGSYKLVRFVRYDPQNHETLFAVGGAGIGKSTDSGETWFDSSSGIEGPITIFDFAFDPQTSTTLYLLIHSGLHKSTNGGDSWLKLTNFYAETITIDPINTSVLYLGYLSSDPYNFYKNTKKSTDGGQTWSLYALDRYRLLIDPQNPNIVYAAAWKKGIFKSTDSGQSWVFISKGIEKLSAGSMTFAPSGISSGHRTLGVVSSLYVGCPVGVVKSSDGGANWQSTNDDLSNKNFSDLEVSDAAGTTLHAGISNVSEGMGYSSGGVYKSVDSGVHWTGLNEGLTSRDVTRVVRTSSSSSQAGLAAAAADTLYTATRGGGIFKSTDGGSSWSPKNNGLDYLYIDDLVLDPVNPDVLYAANGHGVFKSENQGENWTNTGIAVSTNCLAMDPSSPSIIYAGTSAGLYKTIDGGATWQNASTGLGSILVTGIAFDPSDPQKIIAGTAGTGVFQSSDGAANWSSLNPGLNNLQVNNVAIDPSSPATIYASTNGDGLFSLTVAPAPRIAVDKSRLDFGACLGGEATAPQTVRVSNVGDAPLHWMASTSADWIQLSPMSGIDNTAIDVAVKSIDLAVGIYTDTVIVHDPLALNSPQTIAITLKVYGSGSTQPPFGFMDLPLDGTADVTGSIPVSGWVLDDIGVHSVKIYRDPIGSESLGAFGLVFVGDAICIEGARPDVEQAFPGMPQNFRAGWGYMLLTNCLPNQGNGPTVLHAIATDLEGHQVELVQKKTITCDNANAVKPFGAIDTPIQGGEASGLYWNYGWALTPQPNYIPEDGSTIKVWVNGVYIGNPTYNHYRDDIATLFPGYANSSGAVGSFLLDTTQYTNGVHTIAWSAEDSAGNLDGIGSRFFTIVNTGAASAVQGAANQTLQLGRFDSMDYVRELPISFKVVWVRKGYGEYAKPEAVNPDPYGTVEIKIREVERVELDLGKGSQYRGYFVVGEKRRPLPVGSSLDTQNGRFYWQPGPGFIGNYDFVFIKKDEFGMQKKIPVRVKIKPKFGN